MIKLFGKLNGVDLPADGFSGPIDNCIETCFTNPQCILSFMDSLGNCHVSIFNEWDSLEVEHSPKEDGLIVAFKTLLDTCPASSELLDLKFPIKQDVYPWKQTANGWELPKCRAGWERFTRENGVMICIRGFMMAPSNVKLDEAKQYCRNESSVMTGVASVAESHWLRDRVKEFVPDVGRYEGFWTDGLRTCDPPEAECNNFVWSDGFTTSSTAIVPSNYEFTYVNNNNYIYLERCLSVSDLMYNKTLNDVDCDRYDTAMGVACGYVFTS